MENYDRTPLVGLVASDHALRSSLRLLLTISGFEVLEYRSARELLAGKRGSLQCVVADCRADMPSRRLCQEMIQHDERTPFVVLTESAEEFESMKAAHPAVCIITKPFPSDILITAVTELVEGGFDGGPTGAFPAAS